MSDWNPLKGVGASGIGGFLNDLTGKTTSARRQYKYALKLQKDAQEFSKWQMANAHQMETQDLENAGLNPVLSAGGGGASAGVSANNASDGGAGIDPLSVVAQAVNMMNSVKQTNAQVENLEAEKNYIEAQTTATDIQTINETTTTPKKKVIEKLYNIPYLRSILAFGNEFFGGNPGGAAVAGAGTAVSARNANKMANAIKRTPITQETTTHYNGKGRLTGYTTKTRK